MFAYCSLFSIMRVYFTPRVGCGIERQKKTRKRVTNFIDECTSFLELIEDKYTQGNIKYFDLQ